MELFKHRNLALGCGIFLALLLFSYYFNTIIRIAILALSGIAIVTVVLFCLISKRGLKALIKLIPILIFVALAMIVSLFAFDKNELLAYCDQNTEYEVECTIKDVDFSNEYMGIYTVNVHRVDKNQVNKNAKLFLYGESPIRGDVILASGVFSKITSEPLSFDEVGYNLGNGVEVAIESEEFFVIDHKSTPLIGLMENVNSFLDEALKKIGDEDAYSLLSALFLGNTKNLSAEIKRDFTRLGLSHALALSGMHITIVVTILGFGISKLNIKKIYKELLLALSTLFFVGMTGFSPSAMRAGVMVCLVYFLGFLGRQANMVSSLFLSVTVICIFDPYSIFSVSLMLSFFAMLGCLISSRIFKKIKLYRKIRNKLLRYVVFTFVTSVFAIIFTLPIVYTTFGSIPILSPVTNILLAPIFTLLIYLTPVYLACAYIPFISTIVGWFLTQISTFLIFIGERLARLDGILVPIKTGVQMIGIGIIIICVISLLLFNKKLCRYAICGISLGVLVFVLGTGMLHIDRRNNVYVGASYNSTGEALFIEDKNQLTLFNVGASASLPYYTATHLGYYEIENLVITDFNSKTVPFVDMMCQSLIVNNIYAPHPISTDEDKLSSQINEIARNVGANLIEFGNTFKTSSTNSLIYTHKFDFSEKSIVAINVSYKDINLTYLSASTYNAPTYLINELAYNSDSLIFGSYGPVFKTSFEYDVPSLDYAVFLGNSDKYAKEEFYQSIQDKIKPYKKYPIRFKLKK